MTYLIFWDPSDICLCLAYYFSLTSEWEHAKKNVTKFLSYSKGDEVFSVLPKWIDDKKDDQAVLKTFQISMLAFRE